MLWCLAWKYPRITRDRFRYLVDRLLQLPQRE
jgi:hypothetical protein